MIDYSRGNEVGGYRDIPDRLAGPERLNIRDEVRIVRPGFYLGRAYFGQRFATADYLTWGRFDVDPHLSLPLQVFPWLAVKPEAAYRTTYYTQSYVPDSQRQALADRQCDHLLDPGPARSSLERPDRRRLDLRGRAQLRHPVGPGRAFRERQESLPRLGVAHHVGRVRIADHVFELGRRVRAATDLDGNEVDIDGGLVLLDGEGRVTSANQAFCHAFDLPPGEVEGKPLLELGRGEWDTPALRKGLEAMLRVDGRREPLEIRQQFRSVGAKTLRFLARPAEDGASDGTVVVMTVDEGKRSPAER